MSNYAAKFTEELFQSICDEIAHSSLGLVNICKKHKVSAVSFYDWVAKDEDRLNRYVRAREMQADFLADEILEISDDSSKDTTELEVRGEAIQVENREWTNRSRLRVDARKWVASKLKPKKYGDKLDLTTNGKDLLPPPAWLKPDEPKAQ